MIASRLAGVLIASVAFAAPALAQDNWNWHKAVAAGRTIEIKGVNGDVTASASTGGEVEVVARKSAKRSDTDEVRIEVIEHEGGVTICAVYPSRRMREPNECRPGTHGRMNTNNNDVVVDFEVRVPRGVKLAARTVNGAVRASGLTADAIGTTVNGGVRIATTGLAEASTVNGNITVRMGRSNWTDDLDFSTVNGNISIELPDPVSTEVDAATVNGSIYTDWPLTVRGKWGPKRVHGTIGSGGRDLGLSTVNGDIELRKLN
jgi:DUF4097 and DUF4098 domain-containing protein YvlB